MELKLGQCPGMGRFSGMCQFRSAAIPEFAEFPDRGNPDRGNSEWIDSGLGQFWSGSIFRCGPIPEWVNSAVGQFSGSGLLHHGSIYKGSQLIRDG